ncbi:Endonuclease 8 [bacterium HR41]|nr:Endonuclease 8 [bacterium HR41]
MPEGDTIRLAASRIARVLAGCDVVDARAPRARDPSLRLVRTLVGRCCTGVHSHGKHLLVEFEGGLVLHSHLRMSGSWVVTERSAADAGARTGPSTRRRRETTSRLWLELLTDKHAVRQYGGPVLELRSRAGAALALARVGLGPDILAADFDLETAVARLAALDRRLAIADALLDQRALSGIGNIWRAEACFASGIDPFTPIGALTRDDLRTLVGRARADARGCRYGQHPAPSGAGVQPRRPSVPGVRNGDCRAPKWRAGTHDLLVSALPAPRRTSRGRTDGRR